MTCFYKLHAGLYGAVLWTLRLITLDMKDLYVNLPTSEILLITKVLLNSNQFEDTMIQQRILLLHMILKKELLSI